MAKAIGFEFACLAADQKARNVDIVVACPDMGGETKSLNRYPSPYGRIGVPQGHPPIFLKTADAGDHERGVAEQMACAQNRLASCADVASLDQKTINEKRGKIECRRSLNYRLLAHLLRVCQLAETLWANKRLLVPAQVLALRLLPEQVWPRVQSWGLPQTSCIARNTHRAANLASSRACGPFEKIKTTLAATLGWFFVANSFGRHA